MEILGLKISDWNLVRHRWLTIAKENKLSRSRSVENIWIKAKENKECKVEGL